CSLRSQAVTHAQWCDTFGLSILPAYSVRPCPRTSQPCPISCPDFKANTPSMGASSSDKLHAWAVTEPQPGGAVTSGWGRLTPRTVFVLCVAVLVICELVARDHGLFWPRLVIWFVVGCAIGAACHELGHLLCAAIGSIPIRSIVVGDGPLLWRRRFGETWLELRSLPFLGRVEPYSAVNSRWYGL